MEISPSPLSQWQNLAIKGMLKVLDPTKKNPLPPLNHRFTQLIEKKLAASVGSWSSGSRRSKKRNRPV
jgi:hypothetical protein